MNYNTEYIIAVIVALLFVVVLMHFVYGDEHNCALKSESTEPFSTHVHRYYNPRVGDTYDAIGVDENIDNIYQNSMSTCPRGKYSDYELLINDGSTNKTMTSTQFVDQNGIVANRWVAPAWDPNALGPSSKGSLDPEDFESDSRMIYNKCSRSCCKPQNENPFDNNNDDDPLLRNGNYYASQYTCLNDSGNSGCVCMTEKQVKGFTNGFVDYYVDRKNLGY